MLEEIQGDLMTVETLKQDLSALGVKAGMTVLVHSSMKALGGWVPGGPVAVILALEAAVGSSGTLVMPTHTGDLSDPSGWRNPPVRESWWEPIRETMPAFDPDLTPTYTMGAIPECFRKQKGVKRSNHPQLSFAAWGAHADEIVTHHSLEYGLGEQSPLARIYDLSGFVLLLGVGNSNNTSIHLAEYRAEYALANEVRGKAPVITNGLRSWTEFKEVDFDSSDFEMIGNDFMRTALSVRKGRIGHANALLIPQRDLVDYAVQWMNKNRK